MATFKFWNTAYGGKWQKDSGTVHAPKGLQGDDEITCVGNTVSFNIGVYNQTVDLDTDTVEIDDVAFAGTAAELLDELNAVFPKANSGSGGSGITQSALTYAATVNVDFSGDKVKTLALTGNVTFGNASNKAAEKELSIIITADASARTLSFPAWTFVGAKPTTIQAGKTGVLYLYCSGTTEASVLATYNVQQ